MDLSTLANSFDNDFIDDNAASATVGGDRIATASALSSDFGSTSAAYQEASLELEVLPFNDSVSAHHRRHHHPHHHQQQQQQQHHPNGEVDSPSHSPYSLRHSHQQSATAGELAGIANTVAGYDLLSVPLGGIVVATGGDEASGSSAVDDGSPTIQPIMEPYQARADKQQICSERDGQAMYHCHHCTYTSLRFQHMEKHYYAKHAAVKPFNCRYCPYGFPTKERRDNHERSKHTLEKPYMCRFCSRGYPAYSQLHTHIRLKHATASQLQSLARK